MECVLGELCGLGGKATRPCRLHVAVRFGTHGACSDPLCSMIARVFFVKPFGGKLSEASSSWLAQ